MAHGQAVIDREAGGSEGRPPSAARPDAAPSSAARSNPAHPDLARSSARGRHRREAPPGRRGERARGLLLGTAGALGALSLLWLLVSWAFGLTIVVLQTGSMAPTMPAGTAAIVRGVDPASLTAGDVVTVRRAEAALPVTHRVIEVEPLPDGGAILRLQGDANAVPDFEPYTVAEAKLVIASVPGLGTVLQALRTPLALGLITLGVAGAVGWAFWPRNGEGV